DCGGQCGDGKCETNQGENGQNCPEDCSGNGSGGNNQPTCGDGACEGSENPFNCPEDCSSCEVDGFCDTVNGETGISCPLDCNCGNGLCDIGAGEDTNSCPQDCICNGDTTCDPGEALPSCRDCKF
ncbi:MAG: hypothetical protein HYZ79_03420, partial [Candidatus Melainabacteria bacterium]|nr:hypothetical protein [Candidatus Melainabacteria bacterium]